MYEILTELEVPHASRIIDAVFANAAEEHFEVAMAHADKYMDMSDEAFVETESMIIENEIAPVEDAPIVTQAAKKAAAMRQHAAENSMPFDTATSADPSDMQSRLDAAMPKPKILSMLKG